MKKESYYDLLKSPKWQKKRLEILQRDEFKCTFCESDDKQLHVHHIYYLKGKKPWEYDNDMYKTLCDECHDLHHRFIEPVYENLNVKVRKQDLYYEVTALIMMLERNKNNSIQDPALILIQNPEYLDKIYQFALKQVSKALSKYPF